MSRRQRLARPLAAGLLAAAASFAAVALATGSGPADSDIAGPGLEPRRGTVPAGLSQPAPARVLEPAKVSGHREGRAVFARMGCGSCHRLSAAGSEGGIGPDLDERLAYHTRASLAAKIVDPSEGLGEGFSVMPDDFGSRLSDDELTALVEFLLGARRGR
jgi:cytochrome c5